MCAALLAPFFAACSHAQRISFQTMALAEALIDLLMRAGSTRVGRKAEEAQHGCCLSVCLTSSIHPCKLLSSGTLRCLKCSLITSSKPGLGFFSISTRSNRE
eukprot:COSAG06_NODE_3992_length_4680_cov_2.015499_2_plen_102_part_00